MPLPETAKATLVDVDDLPFFVPEQGLTPQQECLISCLNFEKDGEVR